MTNEEAIETLEFMDRGAKGLSPARQLAIKALKNQAKYEQALDMAIECITDCNQCPAYVRCGGNVNRGICNMLIKSALKRMNGIDDKYRGDCYDPSCTHEYVI